MHQLLEHSDHEVRRRNRFPAGAHVVARQKAVPHAVRQEQQRSQRGCVSSRPASRQPAILEPARDGCRRQHGEPDRPRVRSSGPLEACAAIELASGRRPWSMWFYSSRSTSSRTDAGRQACRRGRAGTFQTWCRNRGRPRSTTRSCGPCDAARRRRGGLIDQRPPWPVFRSTRNRRNPRGVSKPAVSSAGPRAPERLPE
jgi:hypothetical protein